MKKLLNITSESQFELIEEARIIDKCDQENLVKFYGVCFNDNKIDQIIMESINCGNLLEYLRESKSVYYEIYN